MSLILWSRSSLQQHFFWAVLTPDVQWQGSLSHLYYYFLTVCSMGVWSLQAVLVFVFCQQQSWCSRLWASCPATTVDRPDCGGGGGLHYVASAPDSCLPVNWGFSSANSKNYYQVDKKGSSPVVQKSPTFLRHGPLYEVKYNYTTNNYIISSLLHNFAISSTHCPHSSSSATVSANLKTVVHLSTCSFLFLGSRRLFFCLIIGPPLLSFATYISEDVCFPLISAILRD